MQGEEGKQSLNDCLTGLSHFLCVFVDSLSKSVHHYPPCLQIHCVVMEYNIHNYLFVSVKLPKNKFVISLPENEPFIATEKVGYLSHRSVSGHVSTVTQSRHTKHWLWRGTFMFFVIFVVPQTPLHKVRLSRGIFSYFGCKLTAIWQQIL